MINKELENFKKKLLLHCALEWEKHKDYYSLLKADNEDIRALKHRAKSDAFGHVFKKVQLGEIDQIKLDDDNLTYLDEMMKL